MREIIQLFFEQVPEFITNMKKFFDQKEFLELGKEAHKAKSSVLIFGMEELGQDLKMLQLDTISKIREESYEQHIIKFEKECLAAIEELKQALVKMG